MGLLYIMNFNGENMMTVYVVIGSLNETGANTDTMQVFTTRDAAVAYGDALLTRNYRMPSAFRKADAYEIIETTVR